MEVGGRIGRKKQYRGIQISWTNISTDLGSEAEVCRSFRRSSRPLLPAAQVNYISVYGFERPEAGELGVEPGDMMYIEKYEEGWCPPGAGSEV